MLTIMNDIKDFYLEQYNSIVRSLVWAGYCEILLDSQIRMLPFPGKPRGLADAVLPFPGKPCWPGKSRCYHFQVKPPGLDDAYVTISR